MHSFFRKRGGFGEYEREKGNKEGVESRALKEKGEEEEKETKIRGYVFLAKFQKGKVGE